LILAFQKKSTEINYKKEKFTYLIIKDDIINMKKKILKIEFFIKGIKYYNNKLIILNLPILKIVSLFRTITMSSSGSIFILSLIFMS
jgi:hypothetical protein